MRCANRRNLIEASAVEGMAAEQAPESESRAAPGAVDGDGADGVLRASGLKAASAEAERVQRGGEQALVEGEEGEEDAGHRDDRPGSMET
jgi:hypothetical protein